MKRKFQLLVSKWSQPLITYRMFRDYRRKYKYFGYTNFKIKISVIINERDTLKAIKKLHTIFDLD